MATSKLNSGLFLRFIPLTLYNFILSQDKDLTIYREQYSENSSKSLNDLIFETAKKLKVKGFIDSVKYAISDDHLSLITAGIPSVDIIDFDYKYWHTEFDTPENCSAESLESVGRVVAEIIYKAV